MKKFLSLFKICSIFLLVLLVFIGWSQIPILLHLKAEKDNPDHDQQTCPECHQLQSIASVLLDSNIGANTFVLKDEGTSIPYTAPILQSHGKTYTISRAPPVA